MKKLFRLLEFALTTSTKKYDCRLTNSESTKGHATKASTIDEVNEAYYHKDPLH